MTTVTLVQASSHPATDIILMTAEPMNIDMNGLSGGNVQYTCTNPLSEIHGAKTVNITYNATVGIQHQRVQVSSVMG